MKSDQIDVTREDVESLKADEILRCLPRERFVEELRKHLEDLPAGEGVTARALLKRITEPEAGMAIQTVAPECRAGSITWVALEDPGTAPDEETLHRQLKMGLQYLEGESEKVILIERTAGLEDYKFVENGVAVWKRVLETFPTGTITRARIVG